MDSSQTGPNNCSNAFVCKVVDKGPRTSFSGNFECGLNFSSVARGRSFDEGFALVGERDADKRTARPNQTEPDNRGPVIASLNFNVKF